MNGSILQLICARICVLAHFNLLHRADEPQKGGKQLSTVAILLYRFLSRWCLVKSIFYGVSALHFLHFNLYLQFCLSIGFLVFLLSFSAVLSDFCDGLINSSPDKNLYILGVKMNLSRPHPLTEVLVPFWRFFL